VVPLDRHREWYRYHRLFRDLLRAELERREPELVPRLHARAAAWCEANGLEESAIDHAQAAGDADLVARLVWDAAPRAYAAGRRPTALAQRCLIAISRQDWPRAEALATQALTVVRDGHLDDDVTSPLVYAVAARVALGRGDAPAARQQLARAARLRPLLTHSLPTYAVQALLELARAYLALNDAAGARAVLGQARDVVSLRPDLGNLPAQVEELRSALEAARPSGGSRSSACSVARDGPWTRRFHPLGVMRPPGRPCRMDAMHDGRRQLRRRRFPCQGSIWTTSPIGADATLSTRTATPSA